MQELFDAKVNYEFKMNQEKFNQASKTRTRRTNQKIYFREISFGKNIGKNDESSF